jgi:pimeloyl-ACP methyl ester carboxylesterase
MFYALTLACLSYVGEPAVESIFQQAYPITGKLVRSPNQTQAIVLVHGFHYHFLDKNVPKATFRSWQTTDSLLVKELGKNADVYSFGYGQNVPLDTIVKKSALASNIAELRKMGYRDIVLVGHSAGGLIARHFVEDFPDAGVTKVVQVCSPNGGSPLANLTAPKSQTVFMECLTADYRKKCLEMRAEKKIPDKVQFVCIVAREKNKETDGVVPCLFQWTPDLQKQGIPAFGIIGGHRQVVREAKMIETISSVLRDNQMRWSPERVEQARKEIFGKK